MGNLNVPGAVTLAFEGMQLSTTPVAIGLCDRVTGRSVIIAAITNCQGLLVDDNTVVFENAFAGSPVCADIVYRLGASSFEQDILFSGRLSLEPSILDMSTNLLIQVYTL